MREKQVQDLRYMGIDVEGAIERFSGSVSQYEEYLKAFVRDSEALLANLEKELSDGRLQNALCLTHDLKEQTGVLGLASLYTLLEELYTRLAEGTEPIACVDEFTKKCYRKIVQQLKEALE